ncbi:MAG: hypothetical protein HY744_19075 [Deltaproteobacteria bacterium]|nr:hypothetical protein [Deltaproteobacteria bacterium]
MLGALYRFQRRYFDGGITYLAPFSYMYQSLKFMSSLQDDERVYLDQLLASLAAVPQAANLVPVAQVDFAEKNVFPSLGGARCASADPAVCKLIALKSLAMGGPLNAPLGSTPTFEVFAPSGDRYEGVVKIELSVSASFKKLSLPDYVSYDYVAAYPPAANNSPPGFQHFKPAPSMVWKLLAERAVNYYSYKPRVYYRVTQCQVKHTECVPTATGPYVIIADTACAFRGWGGGASGAAWAWLLVLSTTLLRGRRSRRSP